VGGEPHAGDVAPVPAAEEARAQPRPARVAVDPRHAEQMAAGLARREVLRRAPAEPRREPADEQETLRRVDLAPVHVDGEADADTGDRVEERAPFGHVEESRDELAPRCE